MITFISSFGIEAKKILAFPTLIGEFTGNDSRTNVLGGILIGTDWYYF